MAGLVLAGYDDEVLAVSSPEAISRRLGLELLNQHRSPPRLPRLLSLHVTAVQHKQMESELSTDDLQLYTTDAPFVPAVFSDGGRGHATVVHGRVDKMAVEE